jgi:hypothetical protein
VTHATNADFETQDATGWDLSYGQVDPAPTAPFSYTNVTPTTSSDINPTRYNDRLQEQMQ